MVGGRTHASITRSMNIRLHHYLWLLSGLALAVLALVTGLPSSLAGAAAERTGLIDLAVAFAAAAIGLALHYRAHASRLAGLRDQARRQCAQSGSRLLTLADDLDRTGAVLVENLDDMAANPGAPTAALYAAGARAHAKRLREMAARLRLAARHDDAEAP